MHDCAHSVQYLCVSRRLTLRAPLLDWGRVAAVHLLEGERAMKLSPPKMSTFVVALIVALVAIIAQFTSIPFVTDNGFWVMTIAFVIVSLGALLKGL